MAITSGSGLFYPTGGWAAQPSEDISRRFFKVQRKPFEDITRRLFLMNMKGFLATCDFL
jgi:hypothetical protein